MWCLKLDPQINATPCKYEHTTHSPAFDISKFIVLAVCAALHKHVVVWVHLWTVGPCENCTERTFYARFMCELNRRVGYESLINCAETRSQAKSKLPNWKHFISFGTVWAYKPMDYLHTLFSLKHTLAHTNSTSHATFTMRPSQNKKGHRPPTLDPSSHCRISLWQFRLHLFLWEHRWEIYDIGHFSSEMSQSFHPLPVQTGWTQHHRDFIM